MHKYLSILIGLFLGPAIVGFAVSLDMYVGKEETRWYEDSHLVCKERKDYGFGKQVEKVCYIIEKIK